MKKFTIAIFMLGLLTLAANVNAQSASRIEITIAGNGATGFTGDGGAAVLAALDSPYDVCMDAAHNIYFVDKANARIRKVSAAKGIISTIAGGGSSLSDGVAALSAAIAPKYMCVDAAGNIYFTMGNQVKKVTAATGMISTVAGTGASGYSGDFGPATAATFNTTEGICVDASGNLFIVDRGNNVIRQIYASTGYIITFVGTGTAGYTGDGGSAAGATLQGPVVVAVNAAGDVYFSDQNPSFPNFDYSVVRMVSASTGNVSTVLGATTGYVDIYNIPALQAELGTITGLCVDPVTHALYCDEMSCSCRDLNFGTDSLYLVAGNFGSQSYTDYINSDNANMNFPVGMCMDTRENETVYIADCGNNRIRKLIQLINAPVYAFGNGQSINGCAGSPFTLDTQMAITDLDSGETITWTVLSAPVNGTLSGFPAVSTSVGIMSLVFPAGVTYTPFSSFSAPDSFQVQVSDGVNTDVVTIYAASDCGYPTAIVNPPATTNAITIFPNPAASVLDITSPSPIKTIGITNLLGQQVYTNTYNSEKVHVDIHSMPNGVYFININGTEVSKFVKE